MDHRPDMFGAPSPPVLHLQDTVSSGQEHEEQQECPPTPLFVLHRRAAPTTWNKQAAGEPAYIRIVVECDGLPDGLTVADRIDPALLFKTAPALRAHLDGRCIILPRASCLVEETVASIVCDLVRCAKEGAPITLSDTATQDPVSIIVVHCILVFFEMHKEAQELKNMLWGLFQMVRLKPLDVMWIWDTFRGHFQSETYIAPFADEYIQMMAWQILNLEAENNLDKDIKRSITMENYPKYFTDMLEKRYQIYGLERHPLAPIPTAWKEISSVPVNPLTNVSREGAAHTANHTGQSSREHDNKPAIVDSLGQQNKLRSDLPRPSGTLQIDTKDFVFSGNKFTIPSRPIVQNTVATSQIGLKASTKRSEPSDGEAGDQKRARTGFNTPSFLPGPLGFGFVDTGALKPNPPTTSQLRFPGTNTSSSTASRAPLNLFSSSNSMLPQPVPTSSSSMGFNWDASSATRPTSSAVTQPTGVAFPFGARPTPANNSPYGGVNTSVNTSGQSPNMGLNSFGASGSNDPKAGAFITPFGMPSNNTGALKAESNNTGTSGPSSHTFGEFAAQTSNTVGFGTGSNSAGAFGSSNAGTPGPSSHTFGGFGAQTNNTGAFGSNNARIFGPSSQTFGGSDVQSGNTVGFGVGPNNFGAFGVTSNSALSRTPDFMMQSPTAASFSTSTNTNFGGQSTQGSGNYFFGGGFAGAAGTEGTENPFAFQGTPARNSKGARSGGMRRIARQTGTRRR